MENLSKAAEYFLDHCRIGRSLSANTLRAYSLDLARFVSFAEATTPLADIDRDTLRDYARSLVEESGLKMASVKRRIASLKAMFRWLEREEAIAVSPFHRLDLVIRLPRRLPRAISPDELRRLMAAIDKKERGFAAVTLRLAVVLMFTTGMRVGELATVRLSDIDQCEQVIQIRGKGDRERRVYLVGQEPRRLLDHYLRARRQMAPEFETLLVTGRGRPATTQWLRHHLRAAAEGAGLPRRVTPHMLRHTAATQLIEAGVDIRFVQKLLGHANIATTQIYTHVSDQSLREAVTRANVLGRLGSRPGRR